MALNVAMLEELHEDLLCSVCLELLSDPQGLRCYHTFCRRCLDPLKKLGVIKCPTCRKITKANDIVDDFRSKRFVEMYQIQVHAKPEENAAVCELCDERKQQFFCNNCSRTLCEGCCKIHLKTTTCKEKDAEKLTEKLQNIMKDLDHQYNAILGEKQRLLKDREQVMEETVNITLECVTKLNDREDQHVQNLHKAYQEQRNLVVNWQDEKLVSVSERCDELVEEAEDMLEHITQVRTSTQSITATQESLRQQANNQLEKLKREVWLPLSLILTTDHHTDPLDPDQVPKVLRKDDSTNLLPNNNMKPSYELRKEFHLEHEVQVCGKILDMTILENKLIALIQGKDFNRKIVELSESGQEMEVICSHGLERAWGMTSSAGQIIVASDSIGLQTVTWLGRIQVIIKGKYFDCCAASDELVYAARVTEKGQPVYVDIIEAGQLMKQVKTQIIWTSGLLTIAPSALPGVALVCSMDHCLYEVSLSDGFIMTTYGQDQWRSTITLDVPKVRCIEYDDLLVTDRNNHRLQVFNTRTKSWSVLKTAEKLHSPDTAVYKGSRLYIGSHDQQLLFVLK